jgi:hypothetical protein
MSTVRSRSTRNATKVIYTNGHDAEEKVDYSHKDMVLTVALANNALTLARIRGCLRIRFAKGVLADVAW